MVRFSSVEPQTLTSKAGTKISGSSMKPTSTTDAAGKKSESKVEKKPPFRPAKDDSKPLLQDPILRSDPVETEEAVLRLPPFPAAASTTPLPKMS